MINEKSNQEVICNKKAEQYSMEKSIELNE